MLKRIIDFLHRFKKPLIIVGLILSVLTFAVVFLITYTARLEQEIIARFDGQRWQIPATVYARPLELFVGRLLSPQTLVAELELAGYRKEKPPSIAGGYQRAGNTVHLITRDFIYPSGREQGTALRVTFGNNRITGLYSVPSGEPLPLLRVDPARIGSFHPQENKDRLVLVRDEIPQQLINTLLVVEDRQFFDHFGISLSGIARALAANIKAGRTVQGGSTLTQQLVKNFFLGDEKTLARKINEALMALLLEQHYSKDEILTAYINEIFLGQDGGRAIHGFGLASQFYFRRDLADLTAAQTATLVGMVKGPSYYDPRRHPERSRQRRDLILRLLASENLLTDNHLQEALAAPLLEAGPALRGFNRFPAFLDLVRRKLQSNYSEQDLTSNGLQILTTLDPQVQWRVERQLEATLAELADRTKKAQLETAVVITGRESGEIQALAAGRNPMDHGFNRALDAKRPIGSLIKPAVYLTALADGYSLDTELVDRAVQWPTSGSDIWRPQNADKKEHGLVPMYWALSHSSNLATVNLGRTLGLERVVATAKKLGLPEPPSIVPSFLLGTAEQSPLDVTQMYQTLAAGGFFVPLRAISSVMSPQGETLQRYGLSIEQRFQPETIFLLNHMLQRVVRKGTGKALRYYLPSVQGIAGKTGTTDGLRDSWFAGFVNDRLGLVWVGLDDNTPTGLTGASGAMAVWGNIFKDLSVPPGKPVTPEGIAWKTLVSGDSIPVRRESGASGEYDHSRYRSDRPPSLIDTIRNWLE